MHRRALYAVFVSSSIGLVACASTVALEPAAGARAAPDLAHAAVATDRGIEVVAQADAWRGGAEITDEVIPLRVVVENRGEVPVTVRTSGFALRAADGTVYEAMPPETVRGKVPVRAKGGFTAPELDSSAPPYAGYAYPSMNPWGGSFEYDEGDRRATEVQGEAKLPTDAMLERALPEGVLEPGERVEGFVYFPKVAHVEDGVIFTARLDEPGARAIYARLEVPFVGR